MTKVFGVGNLLFGDEAIGIRVVESLKEKIESLGDSIEVFTCETNKLSCISNICDNDKVIIIDSTNFMTRPGLITIKVLDECDDFISYDNSLIGLLRKEKIKVRGHFIGIEVSKIDYSVNLSKALTKRFNCICDIVYDEIVKIMA